MRYLQQLELVVRSRWPGSRRDRYALHRRHLVQGALVKGGLFATLAELSAEGAEAAGGPSTPAGSRLAEMSEFYEFLQIEVTGLLDKWRAHGASSPDPARARGLPVGAL